VSCPTDLLRAVELEDSLKVCANSVIQMALRPAPFFGIVNPNDWGLSHTSEPGKISGVLSSDPLRAAEVESNQSWDQQIKRGRLGPNAAKQSHAPTLCDRVRDGAATSFRCGCL
jgi:hypothetical protein